MSIAEPTPPATPARKLGRIDYVFLTLFAAAIAGAVLWGLCGAPPFWNYLDYRSVIVEERDMGRREIRVYDQARIDLPPGVELVLPMTFRERADIGMTMMFEQLDVITRADGKPGEVFVLVETRYDESIRPGQSKDLPTAGGRKVWKRQTGSTLAIDVQHGLSLACYAQTKTVIFVVPPGQSFRHEPPGSPAFAGHTSDEQEKATGWEFVLTSPLSRARFR